MYFPPYINYGNTCVSHMLRGRGEYVNSVEEIWGKNLKIGEMFMTVDANTAGIFSWS